jgi:hypothetical protein
MRINVPRNRLLLLSTILTLSCGVEQHESSGPTDTVTPAGFNPGTNVHKLPWRDPNAAPPTEVNRATAHLDYYGGPVVSDVQVVQVLYGTGSYLPQISSTTSPSMASFYGGVTNSPYFTWLSEYDTNIVDQGGQQGTNQTIGYGTFLNQYAITPSSGNNGSTITDAEIQAELAAQINAGTLPPVTYDAAGNTNTLYMVNFPAGKTITQGGTNSCQSGGFCAYHGTFTLNGKDVYYGVLPDMSSSSGCYTGCGTNSQPFNNQTSVASHELVETVTDAAVGLATVYGPPLAWYDQVNGEAGDICNAEQGTVVGGDGVTYVVQKIWSNTDNACIVQHAVTNDFSISASPTSITIAQNAQGTVTVSTAVTSGSAETVALTVSGVPSGATATFSPTSVTAGGSSTLTISAGTAGAGTYTLTVKGTGTTSHSTNVTLTVTGTITNDFSISASPGSLSLTQGTNGTSTISTAITSGSAETVALTVSGVPSGATATLSPTSVTAGSSSTLTVSTGTAAAGSYTLTVTGTGTTTHSATVALTLSAATGGVVNGGFEAGTLSGWTSSGTTSVVTTAHSGSYAAEVGSSTTPTSTSSLTQTFTVPTGKSKLTLYYENFCTETVRRGYATATVKDTNTGKTTTILADTCTSGGGWKSATASVTAGHKVTVTLTNHDDDRAGDPTYTYYDDVTLQ